MPFRRHLTFANVTAALALFVALGGTGYAAVSLPRDSVGNDQIQPNAISASKIRPDAVGSSEIRANAVGGSEIRANAVGSSEIKRDGVGGTEIRRGAVASGEIRDGSIQPSDVGVGAIGSPQLKDGDVQPADLSAATNAEFQAPLLRAAVTKDGKLAAGDAKSAARSGDGKYAITFDRDVSGCFYAATLAAVRTDAVKTDTADDGSTLRVAGGGTKAPDDVIVETFKPDTPTPTPTQADEPFHLIVAC